MARIGGGKPPIRDATPAPGGGCGSRYSGSEGGTMLGGGSEGRTAGADGARASTAGAGTVLDLREGEGKCESDGDGRSKRTYRLVGFGCLESTRTPTGEPTAGWISQNDVLSMVTHTEGVRVPVSDKEGLACISGEPKDLQNPYEALTAGSCG